MSNAFELNGSYTYADYYNWDGDTRWELIDGWAYAMAAPNLTHQTVLGNLLWKFREFLQGKSCKVLVAPCDVRLNADKADDTVVQPDLLVVCDPAKLADGKAVRGAPDLVIEILSPSTVRHDRIVKFMKYRQATVREIWFVNPDTGDIEVCKRLGDCGEYTTNSFELGQEIVVGILPELAVNLDDIFEPQEQEEAEQEAEQ